MKSLPSMWFWWLFFIGNQKIELNINNEQVNMGKEKKWENSLFLFLKEREREREEEITSIASGSSTVDQIYLNFIW